jgi:hypothetical protein
MKYCGKKLWENEGFSTTLPSFLMGLFLQSHTVEYAITEVQQKELWDTNGYLCCSPVIKYHFSRITEKQNFIRINCF